MQPLAHRDLVALVVEEHRHRPTLAGQRLGKRARQDNVAISINLIEDTGVTLKHPLRAVSRELDFGLFEGDRLLNIGHSVAPEILNPARGGVRFAKLIKRHVLRLPRCDIATRKRRPVIQAPALVDGE